MRRQFYHDVTFTLGDRMLWVFHRRFFLLDRASGITTTNGMCTSNNFPIHSLN